MRRHKTLPLSSVKEGHYPFLPIDPEREHEFRLSMAESQDNTADDKITPQKGAEQPIKLSTTVTTNQPPPAEIVVNEIDPSSIQTDAPLSCVAHGQTRLKKEVSQDLNGRVPIRSWSFRSIAGPIIYFGVSPPA